MTEIEEDIVQRFKKPSAKFVKILSDKSNVDPNKCLKLLNSLSALLKEEWDDEEKYEDLRQINPITAEALYKHERYIGKNLDLYENDPYYIFEPGFEYVAKYFKEHLTPDQAVDIIKEALKMPNANYYGFFGYLDSHLLSYDHGEILDEWSEAYYKLDVEETLNKLLEESLNK